METNKYERKKWFKRLKKFMKLFIKKSEFIYLGEKISNGGIILSNHEGTSSPLALELYSELPIRFWGAVEMNEGLVKMYKYQSEVYYHQKKHWNLFLAKLFCLIASPLTNMFYKGLNLISIHKNGKLKLTLDETITSLKDGQNIVIYPEVSDKGYLKVLEGFHEGCVLLMNYCIKHNVDAPIYISYYKKEEKTYIIDKPVYISQLLSLNLTRKQLAQKLCDRCNELGQMSIEEAKNQ